MLKVHKDQNYKVHKNFRGESVVPINLKSQNPGNLFPEGKSGLSSTASEARQEAEDYQHLTKASAFAEFSILADSLQLALWESGAVDDSPLLPSGNIKFPGFWLSRLIGSSDSPLGQA